MGRELDDDDDDDVTKTPENMPLVFLAKCLISITTAGAGAVILAFCLSWTKIKWEM